LIVPGEDVGYDRDVFEVNATAVYS